MVLGGPSAPGHTLTELVDAPPRAGVRRIRHAALDRVSAAALSLAASAATSALLWALLRWWG